LRGRILIDIRRKKPACETGASSVEFALISGLLFSILFSTIDFGVWAGFQNQVTAGARNAAIQYSISHSTTDATDIVKKQIAATTVSFSVDSIDATTAGCIPGQVVTANVSYNQSVGTGFLFILPAIKASSYAICQ